MLTFSVRFYIFYDFLFVDKVYAVNDTFSESSLFF